MIVSGRFWCAKQIAVVFSPQSVLAGEAYSVCVPRFAGEVIDVGYELTTERCLAPITGVVGKWCELDSRGEARILVPAEHPTGLVRITKVRSRTKNSRWYPAGGAIQVGDATALTSTFSRLLSDESKRQSLVHQARNVLQQHQGATERTAELLEDLASTLPGGRLCR